MARSRQVTIQFLGDSKGLVSAANAAGRSTTTLGDKLKRVGKAAMIGFAGAAVVAAKAGYEFAEMAVEDERSATLMANALKNATGATKDQVAAVEDWISKQGELLGVTDDELRPAISRLAGATGDIGEAEKLASLAMDVSAGKGKDLKTVYEALAKGVDGNVGAIGRLGVKTKDAEGNTKSLKDITDELANLYSGSAAKAADTAAGKFERTKVALSETAESIGYELLPYVTKFGDWLVDDGVPGLEKLAGSAKRELGPALQDLVGFVGDNKDEFADLGSELLHTVIPALRTAGSVVGDAVGFFSDLPQPVKQFGIEAGLAAIALSRLNPNVMSFAALARTSGAAMGEWARDMTPVRPEIKALYGELGMTTTRSAATSAALKEMGGAARAAAGVGGFVLLADGMQRSSSAASTLETTLGGAAAGFAVGGPIGAGVGGLTALFVQLERGMKDTQAAGQKTYRELAAIDPIEAAKASMEDLAATLDQVTGAYTGATRAAVLQRVEEAGLVEVAAKYGISARDVVNAAMGQTDSMKGLAPVVSDLKYQMQDLDRQQRDLASNANNFDDSGFTKSAQDQYNALEKQKKALQENLAELQEMPGKLKAMGRETREAAAATADYTGKLKGLPKQVKTDILQDGMEPSTKAIAELARKYDLTPKQVKTLVQASGADTSARQVQTLIDKMNRLHDKTVTIVTHHSDTYGGQAGGGGHEASGTAGRGSGGKSGRIVSLEDYRGNKLADEMHRGAQGLEKAGAALTNSIAKGLGKGERNVKNVLSGLHDYVKSKTDALQALLDEKSGFVSSFRDAFSENLFGAQFTDSEGNDLPPTLERMMQFAQQRKANADQLAANIQSLLGKGLSKDLIQELVSQGQTGYAQIAALATGTAQDIQAFNALTAQTNKTLDGLGEDLHAKLNPDFAEQVKRLDRQIQQGDRQIELLEAIAKIKGGETKMRGEEIVTEVKRHERHTGRNFWAAS